MADRFTDLLQNYYTRVGNRLVFCNGMSLNHLAWEMWEQLGCREIDPSVLSKVIHGKRLFTPRQLQVFAQILQLDPLKLRQLETSMGDYYPQISPHSILDLIEDDLVTLENLRLTESISRVPGWSKILLHYLTKNKAGFLNDSRLSRYLSLEHRLLVESVHEVCTYGNFREISREMPLLSHQLRQNAIEQGSESAYAQAAAMTGHAYYLQGQPHLAVKHLSASIKTDKLSSDEYFNTLRPFAICLATLGQISEYSEIKRHILSLLPNTTWDYKSSLSEGLARCESLLNHPREFSRFTDQAHQDLEQLLRFNGNYHHERQVQLARTELEYFSQHPKTISASKIALLARQSLSLAQTTGFQHHASQISSSLNCLLNT